MKYSYVNFESFLKHLPKSSIIQGEEWDGLAKEQWEITDKFHGDVLRQVALMDENSFDELWASIQQAEIAFKQGKKEFRIKNLSIIYDALNENQALFSRLIVAEAGKPISFAKAEVLRALKTLQLSIQAAEKSDQTFDVKPGQEDYKLFYHYEAAGPVLGITPFNFPLNLALHKIGPALAAGCPVVIKVPPQCPLSLLMLSKLSHEKGLSKDILNVIACSNKTAEKLVRSDFFKVFSFTGSDRVGWYLQSIAGRKKVLLEAGGNAPAIVNDAKDLTALANRLALSAFAYSGQVCISTQRILVNQQIKQEFVPLLVEAAQSVKSGNPEQDQCINGPLIDAKSLERVQQSINQALAHGAQLLCGGYPLVENVNIFAPTLIDHVFSGMNIRDSEIFGPVAVVEYYEDFNEALTLANDSLYGLQAAVFTDIESLQQKAIEQLKYGTVLINEVPSFRVDQMPYGGMKNSGLGREGVEFAFIECSEIKLVVKAIN
ncbi:MAG: aldehyde dehydrogenase family protein [Flavobacteriales bacterium]